MDTYKMFIGGQWVDALSGETFDDLNPYTGEIYAKVAKGGAQDAERAMAAAYEARQVWAATPPPARAQILNKAAQVLEASREEIAAVLTQEGGGTFGKVMFEISQRPWTLIETAAADGKRILGETYHFDPSKLSMTLRRPRGTVVAISPWNFPLVLSIYKVAYGLATGNTVVLKPASESPVIGLKIGEIFEKAGLPAGALERGHRPGQRAGRRAHR